ncbi:alpha/beta fold hydrolase [Streptomyces sp. NPDC049967]|uniref:alpha/beta fold hydrolase n=1 Tax=unclassified Streptomyces TaxID=2593676 RepID=UPI002E2A9744|nr:alpha/beta fold hydrolase [Streptomyces sp. NBC_00342]
MDVVAVLDYLGIDGADDYGTSMGGRLAQQLAARHPHRVRALRDRLHVTRWTARHRTRQCRE